MRLDPGVAGLEDGGWVLGAAVRGGVGRLVSCRWDRERGGPVTLVDIGRDGALGLVAEGVNGSVVHTPVD